MNKKNLLLSAAAGLLILSAAIESAWAYFTTYADAAGGMTIHLGDVTQIEETVSDWTKHVTITSEADSEPVYVRVRAFSGSAYTLTYSSEDGSWYDGRDGYWYYDKILYGGGKTEKELQIKIDGIPENVKAGEDFNIAVIYESTPVLYKEDGTPYAEWDAKIVDGVVKQEDDAQKEGESE